MSRGENYSVRDGDQDVCIQELKKLGGYVPEALKKQIGHLHIDTDADKQVILSALIEAGLEVENLEDRISEHVSGYEDYKDQ